MPRKLRMYLPDVPCHVIQRGHNRSACFFCDDDYRYYSGCLDDARQKYNVAVHAYVLMTNHVHLLMTPSDSIGISKVMQSLGRRYVQYINKTYKRSGTLWEDRHKASLINKEAYLLTCYKYIELNPVRAGMVEHPGDYPWSSYRYNAYGEYNRLLSAHELYLQLDRDRALREANYRELFSIDVGKEQLHAIRTAANFSMPLGNDRFKAGIEATLKRKIGYAKRGKPAKMN